MNKKVIHVLGLEECPDPKCLISFRALAATGAAYVRAAATPLWKY
jgi:hypothetical protein